MPIASTGTAVLSDSGGSTATSCTATLASTTVGALNIIAVSANTTGTGVDPAQTVSGFTAIPGGSSGKTGTPYHRLSLFYRVFQSGDTNPTVTIAALGNIKNAAVAYTGVDPTTPFVTGEVLAQPQGASSTSWSTGSIVTAALRWIISVFGNRTNGTWSALTDTLRLTGNVASSANIAYEDTNGTVAAGTITARTATFSAATSVGNTVIVALNPAAGSSGTADLSLAASGGWTAPASGTLTLTATAAGAAPAAGTAALTLTGAGGGPFASGTAALSLTAAGPAGAAGAGVAALSLTTTATAASRASGTATLTLTTVGAVVTPLDTWLANPPLYVAHRGGDNDWVEMTRDAYTHATANGAKAINIDAVRCSTGEFVASHDLTTGRVFGTNLTIGSSSWASLSGLTTTTGGFPIEKVADLLAAFPDVVVFVENKGNSSDDTALLDMLDAAGGKARIVIKQYYTAATVAADAHARGYTTWGYYYAADLTNLAATHSRWDLLGLDYLDTSSTDWTNIKALGKPVLGHVTPTASAAAQAFAEGADGVMTGKVLGVIPNTAAATGTAGLSLTASAAGRGPAAGTAVLSLAPGASGVASPAGSAGLTLAAAGAASTTGQAALNLTASAAVAARAAAAAQLVLTGAGGPPSVSGAAALTLTATGAGGAPVAGTGALALTAATPAGGQGTGQAALTLAATGAGKAAGTGTGQLQLAASAQPAGNATGSASLTLAASAPAVTQVAGTAQLGLSATAVAVGPVAGVAALSLTATGVPGGSSPASGTASLGLTATGVAAARGAGAAGLSLTAAATPGGGTPVTGAAGLTVTAGASVAAWPAGVASVALTGTASYRLPLSGGALLDITATASAAQPAAGAATLSLTAGGAAHSPVLAVRGILARLGPDRWACQLGPDRWAVRLEEAVDVRASSQVQVQVQIKAPVTLEAVVLLQFCTNTVDAVPDTPDWQALVQPDASTWRQGEWVTLLAPVGPGLPVGTLYIIPRVTTADEDFREVAGYRQVRA